MKFKYLIDTHLIPIREQVEGLAHIQCSNYIIDRFKDLTNFHAAVHNQHQPTIYVYDRGLLGQYVRANKMENYPEADVIAMRNTHAGAIEVGMKRTARLQLSVSDEKVAFGKAKLEEFRKRVDNEGRFWENE